MGGISFDADIHLGRVWPETLSREIWSFPLAAGERQICAASGTITHGTPCLPLVAFIGRRSSMWCRGYASTSGAYICFLRRKITLRGLPALQA